MIRIVHADITDGTELILHDISLSVDAGERVAITLPGGPAAVALRDLISGNRPPDHGWRETSGSIICANRLATELIAPFSVADNIAYFAGLMHLDPLHFAAAVNDLGRLELLGNRSVTKLDRGALHRLALAMAFCARPDCIAFDADLPRGFAGFFEVFLNDRMPHKAQIRYFATPENLPEGFDRYHLLVGANLLSGASPMEIRDLYELANVKERMTNADC